MDPYIKITKKFTRKFVSKVINRQYFHRKTGLQFLPWWMVHVALPKLSLHQFKPVHQRIKQGLGVYCPKIYVVVAWLVCVRRRGESQGPRGFNLPNSYQQQQYEIGSGFFSQEVKFSMPILYRYFSFTPFCSYIIRKFCIQEWFYSGLL